MRMGDQVHGTRLRGVGVDGEPKWARRVWKLSRTEDTGAWLPSLMAVPTRRSPRQNWAAQAEARPIAMTMITSKRMMCRACGTLGSYCVLVSTNSFGDPDLDSRPQEMARGDVLRSLMRCEHCDYCAPTISEGPENVSDAVRSAIYKTAVTESPGPPLARHWHCWSLVNSQADDRATAGWADVQAAWVSEDARDKDAARRYRAMALDHLSAWAKTRTVADDDPSAEHLVILDILRRLGHYSETAEMAKALTRPPGRGRTQVIVQFQEVLARRGDDRRYTVEDARKHAASPEKWTARQDRRDSRQWWQFWR